MKDLHQCLFDKALTTFKDIKQTILAQDNDSNPKLYLLQLKQITYLIIKVYHLRAEYPEVIKMIDSELERQEKEEPKLKEKEQIADIEDQLGSVYMYVKYKSLRAKVLYKSRMYTQAEKEAIEVNDIVQYQIDYDREC